MESIGWMEIAMLIIAVSVAVLVVFLVKALRKATDSLDTANATLTEARDAINMWKDDVQHLVVSVKDLTNQVNRQVEAVDPLMASVRDMGEALHEVTTTAKEASVTWMDKVKERAVHAGSMTKSSWMDWVEMGVKGFHVIRSASKVLRTAPQTADALKQQDVKRDIDNVKREIQKTERLQGRSKAVTI
ncbi:hypothetical protein DNH61_17165 [Paenibacillus sambharensis]|uniref:DUF948 domain-containing protein n=1 Tax=Paenibacillus sambharensis TaxID=1803190 RepID=A0A2W1LS73_9BACL|nr:DUF948 domain-containing protein [Paenibacillus sambharensis]PZD94681.1 hypothetical protein DNH61_17165 [Paenibacillus sambharensis]